jgi:hypothetical protein
MQSFSVLFATFEKNSQLLSFFAMGIELLGKIEMEILNEVVLMAKFNLICVHHTILLI